MNRSWMPSGLRVPALLVLVVGFGCSMTKNKRPSFVSDASTVGRVDFSSYITPTGQLLTPAGEQIELPGMRPQALAFSPDGKVVATSGKTNSVVLIDLATGLILQRATLSTNRAEAKAEAKADKPEDPAASPEVKAPPSSGTNTNAATTNKISTA